MKTHSWWLLFGTLAAASIHAQPLPCDVSLYQAAPGLMATRATDALTVTWDGDKNSELRLMLALKGETPVIRELAVRHKGQEWVVMVSNAVPEFRVVSGLRRITNQQLTTLTELGVKVTPELVNQFKWDAFWDAPLNVPGGKSAHGGSTPPQDGIFDQPGLPRKAEEVTRTPAVYRVRSCEVKSNGGRLEISFPGVTVGVFTGRLQYTVYRGINLIRQEIIAKTSEPSVAYKYDAGISGLTIRPGAKVVWRDVRDHWKNAQLDGRGEGSPGPDGVIVKAANRLLAARGAAARSPSSHLRTTSSGRARSLTTSAITGIARMTQARLPWVCAKRRTRRVRGRRIAAPKTGGRTSRCAVRVRIPGSGCQFICTWAWIRPSRPSMPL